MAFESAPEDQLFSHGDSVEKRLCPRRRVDAERDKAEKGANERTKAGQKDDAQVKRESRAE